MSTLSLRERFDPRRFLRGEKAVSGSIALTHRRIFIVPTRRGFGLALLLLIQWLAAINYGNNLAFILTFLLASVALLAALHTFRNLSGLRVRVGGISPVFAGDCVGIAMAFDNPTPLSRHGVWIKARDAEPVRTDLPAEGPTSALLRVRTERRGWYEPGTITAYTEFPLGIFHAWSPLNFKERVLVYPKPAADVRPFPGSEGHGPAGAEKRDAEDFYGFQAYQPGDSLRHLHWKGVAKGLDPQIKRYSAEQADSLHFSLETTPGAHVEARLSRLCRWILDAEALGLRYSLDLPGYRLAAGCGPEHRRRCLEALALFSK